MDWRLLALEFDEVDAAILLPLGVAAALLGIGRTLREGFQALGVRAEGLEVTLHRVGATVTEAEVVFSSAAPVAMADEHQALLRIVLQPRDRGFKLRAFGGRNGRAIEAEIDGVNDALVLVHRRIFGALGELG